MSEQPQYIFKDINVPGIDTIDVYEKHGGYTALRKALTEMTPLQVQEEVKAGGLLGRGGAGFPTGLKWSFLAKTKPAYLLCNADESEPGTFKDRQLIQQKPHQLIEGVIITSYAIGASKAFIFIRGEMAFGARQLNRAVAEATAKGYLGANIMGTDFSIEIIVHRGAGAYICGEETALMEALEGKRGYPRLKPPFPAVAGVYGKPTIINNVETLSTVPHIVNVGSAVYASVGTEKSKGTRVYCLSGHVNKPGNYELTISTTFRELIYEYGGGMRNNKALKGFIPGGTSMNFLTPDKIDTPMAKELVNAVGSDMGSAGVIVFDEDTCIVAASLRIVEFYKEESCGKCTPCREGTQWLVQIMERIEHGEGRLEDIPVLQDICDNLAGRSFCLLGDAATSCIVSSIKNFLPEYEYHIRHKTCLVGPKAGKVTVGAH